MRVFGLAALFICDLRPTSSVEDSAYPSATDLWRVRRRHHNGPVVARGGTCDHTYYRGLNRSGAGMYGKANLVYMSGEQFRSWYVVEPVILRVVCSRCCTRAVVTLKSPY